MPDVSAGAYLIDYLYECGPSYAAGMGAGALPHSEIAAWQWNTGVRLQPWEARFIRSLSRAYVAESNRALASDCPPPWDSPDPIEKKRVAESMRYSIRQLTDI